MRKKLGSSNLMVTPVAMGCWPIAGMTSLGVNSEDSLKTLSAALDAGINFFDTAYCYGADGISERLVGQAVSGCRDDVVIATKCGVHWDSAGQKIVDGSRQRILVECDESLQRLGTEHIDLMYLHKPDPELPISESAGALAALKEQGKIRYVGVSNVTLEQLVEFHHHCPVVAVQLPFNMFQQGVRDEFEDRCAEDQIAIVNYWPLMKGLLAGKIRRDHKFDPQDKRLTYPIFQGEYFDRVQKVIDGLDVISRELDVTIAQLVVAWTFHQSCITSVLCGAKRDWQISETAVAMRVSLSAETLNRIDMLVADFSKQQAN